MSKKKYFVEINKGYYALEKMVAVNKVGQRASEMHLKREFNRTKGGKKLKDLKKTYTKKTYLGEKKFLKLHFNS